MSISTQTRSKVLMLASKMCSFVLPHVVTRKESLRILDMCSVQGTTELSWEVKCVQVFVEDAEYHSK